MFIPHRLIQFGFTLMGWSVCWFGSPPPYAPHRGRVQLQWIQWGLVADAPFWATCHQSSHWYLSQHRRYPSLHPAPSPMG